MMDPKKCSQKSPMIGLFREQAQTMKSVPVMKLVPATSICMSAIESPFTPASMMTLPL